MEKSAAARTAAEVLKEGIVEEVCMDGPKVLRMELRFRRLSTFRTGYEDIDDRASEISETK